MAGSSAEAFAARANTAYVEEEYEEAVELYSQAIAKQSHAAKLYAARSAAFLKLGQDMEALDDANKAVQLDPNLARAHARRGEALLKEEEYEAAKDAFETAASLDTAKGKYSSWLRKCDTELAGEQKSTAIPSTHTNGHHAKAPATPSPPLPSPTNNTAAPAPAPSATPSTTADPMVPDLQQPSTGQLGANGTEAAAVAQPKYRHQHFQTPAWVEVAVLAKKLTPDRVTVSIEARSLSVTIRDSAGQEEFALKVDLWGAVNAAESTHELLSTKIEIRLKKAAPNAHWPSLEASPGTTAPADAPASELAQLSLEQPTESRPSYPTSRKNPKDWDKLAADVKKEEKEEHLDGEAGLQKLFRDIYGNSDEDTRRAMNKSFQESNGTVLSTNWKDIGARKVKHADEHGKKDKNDG